MKRKICEGRITSPFGIRVHPVTKQKGSFHNGIDIACSVGTEVLTPVDALVTAVYTHEAGGKTVIIKDLNSTDRYGFAHLSKQLVKVGQLVPKGSVIALSGNTGRSTGPHLHLTRAIGGKWNGNNCTGHVFVDPTPILEFEI
ncbi:MAG: M23 family metallopeptidase [Bacteroidia bacterium]|nr:M23 family metallopeptidase [Bacteroidia bacterium]